MRRLKETPVEAGQLRLTAVTNRLYLTLEKYSAGGWYILIFDDKEVYESHWSDFIIRTDILVSSSVLDSPTALRGDSK